MVAIAAGRNYSLALKADTTVVTWGDDNSHGQVTVPRGLSGVMAIAAGGFHSLALKTDGSVAAWRDDQSGQCTALRGLSGFKAISAGSITVSR